MTRWLVGLWLALAVFGATAREAVPLAEDQAVEQRLIAIAEELRCLVCQNESLAGSRADLAQDLRREIRALIRAGKTDPEILDYRVSRYGDFVRYRPPSSPRHGCFGWARSCCWSWRSRDWSRTCEGAASPKRR
jgi:cytochrome c-type biogenesis protein CcmH